MQIETTGATGQRIRCRVAGLMLAATAAIGCGGDSPRGAADAATTSASSPPEAAKADTAAPSAVSAPSSASPGSGSALRLVALGDSVYHGLVGGGTCQACHGPDAKGTPIAPDLTDAEWLHSDGSLPALTRTITSGVPIPKKYPAAMPPLGGAALSPAHVGAVAAYVHSLRLAR